MASLRLMALILKKGGKEMCVYSDSPTQWLFEDAAYLQKWAMLMAALIRKGVMIRVIHNIDRNPAEMHAALRSWLPIYMSGMVEPYYNQKNCGERFSHTLFVCPGVASVSGFTAHGQEDGICRFDTNADAVKNNMDMFHAMLKGSKRLLKITSELPAAMDGISEEILKDAFSEVRIIKRPDAVIVERLSDPHFCFLLYHPLLLKAFEELAEDGV